MGVSNFQDIMDHLGHEITVTFYGLEGKIENAENASIECLTCSEVLVDHDKVEDQDA